MAQTESGVPSAARKAPMPALAPPATPTVKAAAPSKGTAKSLARPHPKPGRKQAANEAQAAELAGGAKMPPEPMFD